MTFINGLGLVLGLQIGSGIFFAPSQVLSNHVSSPGIAVLVWPLAGILVWTGAASFIELGQAIPQNGGVQEYLRSCYSDFLGFLFSWVWITIGKPCGGVALTAVIFAENLSVAVVPEGVRPWQVNAIAVIGLLMITLVNCSGRVAGPRVANVFLVLKILALSSIVVIGAVAGFMKMRSSSYQPDIEWFGKDPDQHRQASPVWAKGGEFITAIYGALFCYGGWETMSISLWQHLSLAYVTDMQFPCSDRICCW